MNGWRILESLHGHAGVLAAAALAHPAILLRNGAPLSWRSRWSVGLTAGFVVAAFASGLFIYGAYVEKLRVQLFLQSERAGLLFETKEHLAFAVTSLALGAGVCALAAPRGARALRRAAAAAFGVAAVLCLCTAGLGTYISSVHGFGAVTGTQ